jgi:Sulfotransferase domain
MPVFKQHLSVVARGMKAFLNLEAGVTRAVPVTPQAPGQATSQRSRASANGKPAPSGGNDLRPENIVWIFGSGRSGSTWLSSMMGDMSSQTLWGEPWVGTLFGNFYYSQDEQLRRHPKFILGRHRESWLDSIRTFVLNAATATFPNLKNDDYLIIKEPNGSIGAPLIMEALPESRMILLVRDPRDVIASSQDARREGGWNYVRNKGKTGGKAKTRELGDPPKKGSVGFAEKRAQKYLQGMGNAKLAYDAHTGPKVLIRYEELRADTLATMKLMYSTLGLPVEEGELAQVVEKHSWENIPEEQKGEGKFYRKATPGGWREDLTREQAEMVERITAPLLKELYPEKV